MENNFITLQEYLKSTGISAESFYCITIYESNIALQGIATHNILADLKELGYVLTFEESTHITTSLTFQSKLIRITLTHPFK